MTRYTAAFIALAVFICVVIDGLALAIVYLSRHITIGWIP